MQPALFGNIYNGKTVFITGHTGFKGSWLSLWLLKLGAKVIGYSIGTPTQPSHFDLLKLDINSITGDILNRKALESAIIKSKPDIVFHLAAQPIVKQSYENPVETFETNVMGTVNVLESCRLAEGVKAIVNVTSDKCYRNNEWEQGYKENDPLGGNDPYSASKGCAEIVGNSYRNSFFNLAKYGQTHATLLADARAGNVVGGGDWAKDRIVPDLMRSANKGESTFVRHPKATRPWQHVLEPLSGYLQLGWRLLEGKKEFADNWNFGPEDEAALSVQEIIHISQRYWDQIKYTVDESLQYVHEAKLLKLDSTKARKQLQWKSVWQSEKTFEKTIQWYKEYYSHNSIRSEQDLSDFVTDATAAFLPWTKI